MIKKKKKKPVAQKTAIAPSEQIPEVYETTEMLESNVEMSFFYTSDKIINALDNIDILKQFRTKYPELRPKNTDFIIKKTIVQILNDEKFVERALKYYNITIQDFFKILYKEYSSVFNGIYMKKLKKVVNDKSYAICKRRKSDY